MSRRREPGKFHASSRLTGSDDLHKGLIEELASCPGPSCLPPASPA